MGLLNVSRNKSFWWYTPQFLLFVFYSFIHFSFYHVFIVYDMPGTVCWMEAIRNPLVELLAEIVELVGLTLVQAFSSFFPFFCFSHFTCYSKGNKNHTKGAWMNSLKEDIIKIQTITQERLESQWTDWPVRLDLLQWGMDGSWWALKIGKHKIFLGGEAWTITCSYLMMKQPHRINRSSCYRVI